MIVLLRKQSNSYVENFSKELIALTEQYRKTDLEHQIKIKSTLAKLQKDSSLSPQEFAEVLETAGVLPFAENELKAKSIPHDKKLSLFFDRQIEKIAEARDISELDYHVTQHVGWLSRQDQPSDFQKILKTNVISKLKQFLYPENNDSHPSFGKYDRKAIIYILKKIGISEPEEQANYLNQFDKLQEKNIR